MLLHRSALHGPCVVRLARSPEGLDLRLYPLVYIHHSNTGPSRRHSNSHPAALQGEQRRSNWLGASFGVSLSL